MRNLLHAIIISLMLATSSCNTADSEVKEVSESAIKYFQKLSVNKGLDFKPLEYKYSDVVNGECDVVVLSTSGKENGTIKLGLKKFNGRWMLYRYAVSTRNDHIPEYELLPVPMGVKELDLLNSKSN